MMDCRRCEEKLPAYNDGELAGDELQEVRLHVEACEPCQKVRTQLQVTWDLLGAWEELTPSPTFRAQVWERIRTAPPERRWSLAAWWRPALGAAFALVLMVGVWITRAPMTEPSHAPTATSQDRISALAPEWRMDEVGVFPDKLEESQAEHLVEHLKPLPLGEVSEDLAEASQQALDEELGGS